MPETSSKLAAEGQAAEEEAAALTDRPTPCPLLCNSVTLNTTTELNLKMH